MRTRRRNVRSERLRGTVDGAVEGAKSGRNGKKKERRRRRRRRRRGKKRDPHSRRLSCSPSAYHGVRGQDLYVEFIVAESALLRFMDVFRRSAAARVIYRGTLALLPSPSRSVTELFSLSRSPPPLPLLPCRFLCSSRSLHRSDSVHEGGAEGDRRIPNERYDGILFSSLSLALSSLLSRRLSGYLSLSLLHFLSCCLHTFSLSL